MDVAVVVMYTADKERVVVLSEGVPFPATALDEARRRGFKATTVGDIIHERDSTIPANDWHSSVIPGMTRTRQIQKAVMNALDQIKI